MVHARGRGTNTGPLPPFAPQATGKQLVNPPQVCSLTFDKAGLVTRYTIGYVVDRQVGTTGGLGGLYGVLYAIGRPLAVSRGPPWRKSPQYALFRPSGARASRSSAKYTCLNYHKKLQIAAWAPVVSMSLSITSDSSPRTRSTSAASPQPSKRPADLCARGSVMEDASSITKIAKSGTPARA